MKIQIKNTDEDEELFISGIQKDGPSNEYNMGIVKQKVRFVLRPGETKEFSITTNEILGLETL